jgi:DNA end-binding protein Ku
VDEARVAPSEDPMARPLWRGSITFSLVNVPVAMYTASHSREIDLDLIDRRDFSPIGYRKYNKRTGEEVQQADIVRAFQHEKGEYVVLTDEDFRQANVEATRTIDIQAFVERSAVGPEYFDTPYYLEPEKGAEKTYALLSQVLERSGRIAIAKLVLRVREHLAAVMPVEGALRLHTLRFHDELVPAAEHQPKARTAKSAGVTAKEINMALRLVEDMADEWRPEAYHDTYREDLMRRIEDKVRAGQAHHLTESAPEEKEPAKKAGVVDLVALLERSLAKTRQTPAPRSTATRRRARTATRRPRRA